MFRRRRGNCGDVAVWARQVIQPLCLPAGQPPRRPRRVRLQQAHGVYELANAHAQAWRAAGCVVVGAEFEADEEAGPKVFACMLPKIFYSQS